MDVNGVVNGGTRSGVGKPVATLAVVRGDGVDDDRDGLTEHRPLGTYCHVHPESGAFDALVEAI